MLTRIKSVSAGALLTLLVACSNSLDDVSKVSYSAKLVEAQSSQITNVDGKRIIAADKGEWLSYGRTYSEQRFSPLALISDKNVSDLGLAWYADFPTDRGIETTPLIADGTLYVTGSWGHVLAFDAKTGQQLWHYDPQVPKDYSRYACCDAVNRGAALWQDKVFVGSLDGRLIALSRDTGKVVWSVDTRTKNKIYTITGAPRVVNGKVIIGNGGAEMGARGYVTAYDAETGEQAWRFFTVPGNPTDGFEDETQKWIAETWTGEWWKHGGGGTAWDSFAFDPELNLLYIGVGNGSNWNQKIRSPEGGDNLFLSSIVAVNADTGKYVWHYQTTPGDNWDYTATQSLILAELTIAGEPRNVIMQAPKNGFFYVLDRATGELLSAEKYMPVNWASHVDKATGRPVEHPDARNGTGDLMVVPSSGGAHSWHPMAFSPDTGYAYIPAMTNAAAYVDELESTRKTIWNLGYQAAPAVSLPDVLTPEQRLAVSSTFKAVLIARDPASNKEVWRKEQGYYSGSGILATAGNLLFQGNLEGQFKAFAADDGEQVWSQEVQAGIMGSPVTYEIDGEQYVAVAQGWGGNPGFAFGVVSATRNLVNISRLLVYKLGAKAKLPTVELAEQLLLAPQLPVPHQAQYEQGRGLYNTYCFMCHGGNAVSAGIVPDLRYTIANTFAAWQAIVIDGGLKARGMPAWQEYMTAEEADAIKAYVIHEARLGAARGEKRTIKKR